MSEKFFVIARTNEQGRQWLNNKRAKDSAFYESYPNYRDVIIVTSPESVRGYTIKHGTFLPGWKESTKDPIGLLQILYYASNGNTVIRKMLEEDLEESQKKTNSQITYEQVMTEAVTKLAADLLAKEIDKEVLRSLGINI